MKFNVLIRAARDEEVGVKAVVETESGGYHTEFRIDEAGTPSSKNAYC